MFYNRHYPYNVVNLILLDKEKMTQKTNMHCYGLQKRTIYFLGFSAPPPSYRTLPTFLFLSALFLYVPFNKNFDDCQVPAEYN